MTHLLFSPRAKADFGDIWDYTADRWGPEQADDYTGTIYRTCEELVSGRRASQAAKVRQGYRKCRAGSHMIYFTQGNQALVVVRILHAQMDAERHL